ncbi:PseG/SpsG family protein [Candidatus Omnitrophota bacterium]
MRIAILTEGGSGIGFGHMTRCLSLYTEFKSRNLETLFIINNNKEATDRLRGIIYSVYEPEKCSTREMLKLLSGFDCVIVDSYILTRDDYLKIQESTRLLVSIDDNNRIDYPSGIVLNGSIYADELKYPKTKDITYLLGTEYIPIRREFCEAKAKDIKKDISSFLITFGGYCGPDKIINDIKDTILSQRSSADLNVTDGGLKSLDMLRLMEDADIAISAGGQTLYELARAGTPTIGICMAENQLRNLEGWARRGFLEYCGWYNDRNLLRRIKEAIKRLMKEKVRKAMRHAGLALMDGKGTQRTVDRIIGTLK